RVRRNPKFKWHSSDCFCSKLWDLYDYTCRIASSSLRIFNLLEILVIKMSICKLTPQLLFRCFSVQKGLICVTKPASRSFDSLLLGTGYFTFPILIEKETAWRIFLLIMAVTSRLEPILLIPFLRGLLIV
ncbi:hypothetical protein LINGRAHAP2_LOCUS7141, partial [Linum grandiflorum]